MNLEVLKYCATVLFLVNFTSTSSPNFLSNLVAYRVKALCSLQGLQLLIVKHSWFMELHSVNGYLSNQICPVLVGV